MAIAAKPHIRFAINRVPSVFTLPSALKHSWTPFLEMSKIPLCRNLAVRWCDVDCGLNVLGDAVFIWLGFKTRCNVLVRHYNQLGGRDACAIARAEGTRQDLTADKSSIETSCYGENQPDRSPQSSSTNVETAIEHPRECDHDHGDDENAQCKRSAEDHAGEGDVTRRHVCRDADIVAVEGACSYAWDSGRVSRCGQE